jgi:hypothetical protein
VRIITPQPLVSSWSAMVAYLFVSPCAFWTSASNPASVKAFVSAGRSPFSHRGDEAESGRITQAREAVVAPPVPPPPEEQPDNASADAETTTAIGIHDFNFMAQPFFDEGEASALSALGFECWHRESEATHVAKDTTIHNSSITNTRDSAPK